MKKETRDKVWPTDVFGNPADKQHISHLLPVGRHDHKEWFPVGVAVVGLEMAGSIDADALFGLLKKVTRGFLDPTAKTPPPPKLHQKRESLELYILLQIN